MAVNIKLKEKFVIDRATDSMGRTWAGWDEDASDQVNWDHNRGRHTFGDRVDNERYATLSYDGRIRVVAELSGREQESNPRGVGRKWSLEGRVLPPGDPVREAFLRLPAPTGRNTIAYIGDPSGVADPDAFLLTNNPKKWDMDPDLLADWILATAAGHSVEGRWSTGGTTKKIVPGDRAFLLRQGVPERGIFASGTFTSSVFQAEHWDGSGAIANYADVSWDTVIDPDDPLSIESLLAELPEGQWEPQASGTQVNPAVVAGLERLWSEHVASVGGSQDPTPPTGSVGERQGRRLDAILRKQIEDLAQDRLTALYESDGWDVEDLRYGNPFDAKATKGGDVIYLEAEGTTTAGERVIVTRNEVAFAREHPGECVIGIVAGIRLDSDGNVDGASGELRLYAWEPDDDDLVPLEYDFYPPDEQRLED
ncbi:protein NO VEIN domain-containing protein [Flexivirga lutea]